MTKDEAIAMIKECLENNLWGCGKYTEALVMAISVLSEKGEEDAEET